MKTTRNLIAIVALSAGLCLKSFAASSGGVADFGTFTAPDKGQFVEVCLSSNLISLAARFVEKQQPDAAKMLRSVQQVRVNVIGITEDNRADLEKRVHSIRKELDNRGWERIVTAQDKGDVSVNMFLHGDQSIGGIAVTVIEPGKNVVLINLVGDIKPEQVAAVGEALNLDPLKQFGQILQKK